METNHFQAQSKSHIYRPFTMNALTRVLEGIRVENSEQLLVEQEEWRVELLLGERSHTLM